VKADHRLPLAYGAALAAMLAYRIVRATARTPERKIAPQVTTAST